MVDPTKAAVHHEPMSKPISTDGHRRRRLVQALAALLLAPWNRAAAALAPTPSQTAGPFYPRRFPADLDDDLTAVAGQPPAQGEHAWLSGRVLTRAGNPVAGAWVEIWQCDARGIYHHVGFDGGDPGFQGYGYTHCDAQGAFAFKTILPVPYGGRPPHVHVRVSSDDELRLTTQIYIKGHPANARDSLFDPELAADWLTQAGRVSANFDLVI